MYNPPLSLAVQPAGALCRAQGELAGVEVGGVALAVVTIVHTLAARPANQSHISIVVWTNESSPSYAVACGLAEGLAQVAAGRKQVLQVAQAELSEDRVKTQHLQCSLVT